MSAFEALEAARRAGDRAAEARALVALAEETPLLSANFERAGWWLLEAQEIAAAVGLPDVEARALARFAELSRRAGGLEEARAAARQAGAAAVEALAALDAGDVEAARAALAGADPQSPLGTLAFARLVALDDLERARARLAALPPAEDAGDRYEQFLQMATWSLLLGDLETAAAGGEEAMAIADALRSPHEALVCGALLGVVRLFEGRGPAAVEALAGVVRVAAQMDAVWGEADPPAGRGHPLLCLAGVRSARAAVARLVRTGEARGGADLVLCALTAAAFRYADGDAAGASATCDAAAAGLDARLATPLYRLAEALRAES